MADEENREITEDPKDTPKNDASAPAAGGNAYLMKERYEIDFSRALPALDSNGAKAYAVRDLINPRRDLFALLCDNNIPPRSSVLPYLKSIDHPNIMKLIEYGVVDYVPKKSRNMALVYQKPQGKTLKDMLSDDSLRDSQRFKSLMLKLLSAAEVLKGYNIIHRSIRLDNIYFKDEALSDIMLGDCAASFPAFYQPAAYETVESSMSEPEGRGNGNARNDIYAIGVVALNLLLGKELLNDLSTPEILRLKLKKGSYAALSNDEKVPNSYVTLFKGLLHDDEALRWNYVQAYNALEGKPNTFNSPANLEKPKKSLTVGGEKVYNPRHVAFALYNNPKEAMELIQSGKILDWIRNGLENEKLYGKVEKLIKQHNETPQLHSILIAKICIYIDPSAPIKIDDISILPDGAPKAIFYAIKNHKDLKPYIDLFSSDLIKLWYMEQENLRSPANAAEFKIYINRKDLGYGIERIMYDFDDDLPCISPLLGDEFVNTSHRILKALDDTYGAAKNSGVPYDKTIIAYLRCKMGKKIDGIIVDLNSNKEELQVSAVIRLYTTMQNKYGPANLANLCRWLASISQPLIKSYHNVKYQKHLERELLKVAKEGKISALHEILENEEAREKDKNEYAKALNDITYLVSEKSKIVSGGSRLDEEARELGLKLGSVIAITAMIASFIFNLIYWIVQ